MLNWLLMHVRDATYLFNKPFSWTCAILTSLMSIISAPLSTNLTHSVLERTALWSIEIFGGIFFGQLLYLMSRERIDAMVLPLRSIVYGTIFGTCYGTFSVLFFNGGMPQGNAGSYVFQIYLICTFAGGGFYCCVHILYPSGLHVPRESLFIKRLPKDLGTELRYLHAQDHYVKVATKQGEEFLQMRFQDALNELEEWQGLQVHRSYWVARDAVSSKRWQGGRLFLILKSGEEIPVSRSYRAALKSRGVI